MKLPRAVILSGKKFKVTVDASRDDGECDLENMVMIVGGKNLSDILENFMHECFETILVIRSNRYTVYAEGNDKIKFVLDHAEFENAVKDFALAMEGVVKK
jgi:uncharacterized protein YpbB